MRIRIKLLLAIFFLILITEAFSQPIKDSILYNMSIKELMNVKVYSASKKNQLVSDAPSIITLITSSEIKKSGATTLIDILKNLPSIETSMDANGHYRVSIRGIRKDGNVLILLNGNHIHDFYDGKALYDLPIDMIEKIEVIRGPGSALFGTNAVAGIINIFTVKKQNNISIATGYPLAYSGNLNTFIEKENFSLNLTTGYSSSESSKINPYSAPLDKLYTDKTNRWLKDAYFISDFSYYNISVLVSGLMRNQGSWVGPLFDLTSDCDFKNYKFFSEISYNWKLSNNITLTPKLQTDYIYHNYLLVEHPAGFNNFPANPATKENYSNINIASEIQANYILKDNFDIISGFVFEDMKILDYNLTKNYDLVGPVYKGIFDNYNNIVFNQSDKKRQIYASYIQCNFRLSKFGVTAGLRYDKYSDFGTSTNPRIGIVYKLKFNEESKIPFKTINFKLLYGQAFRAPTFKELYDKTNITEGVAGCKGNPDLKPEKVQSTEFAIELANNNFILRSDVFYNYSSQIIGIYDATGSSSVGDYDNIGNTKSFGYDIEAIYNITKKIRLKANISQFQTTFEWNDMDKFKYEKIYLELKGNGILSNIPSLRINGSIDMEYKNLYFAFSINYGNSAETNNRYRIEFRDVSIPEYLQSNIVIKYKFSKKIELMLSANNLGKIKYSDPDESTNINLMGRNGMAQPTNSYYLKLNIAF